MLICEAVSTTWKPHLIVKESTISGGELKEEICWCITHFRGRIEEVLSILTLLGVSIVIWPLSKAVYHIPEHKQRKLNP